MGQEISPYVSKDPTLPLLRFEWHFPAGDARSLRCFIRSVISLHCDAVAEIGPGAASLLGDAMNRSPVMRAIP